jgi:hypothetical protein
MNVGGSETRPRLADRFDSWWRSSAILAVIVSNGIWEETLIVRAESMMLARWARDVIRYDLRWMIQEKLKVIGSGAARPRKHS